MSLLEVEHLLRRLLSRHQTMDDAFMTEVLAEKEQVMRKEGILEFVPPDPRDGRHGRARPAQDLGAPPLQPVHTRGAGTQGLPRPKGVLLMGMSGCGKSLAVKVIATEWKLPLFRLDMNLVFAGVQGSPEWVFHRALEAVEAVAPAVLWIDEIEMGIAGYREGETGSVTRIFSTFLTWMQEHRADVFIAATANRINLLPAEIIRKGRFDQVFFVELPNEEERKEILTIHMRRQDARPGPATTSCCSPPPPAAGTAPRSSRPWSRPASPATPRTATVDERDLLTAMGMIVPLSTTMSEQIKAIRSWARTRALPATTPGRPEM